MSKAGPLARSRSGGARETEPDAGCHEWTTFLETTSYNIQGPSQRGDIGRILDSDEKVIGLALGSPGHPPLQPDDQDVDVDVPGSFSLPRYPSSQLGTVSEVGTGGSAITRKGSKWKSFGSLFGRKNSSARAPQVSPFYQLDHAHQQGLDRRHINQDHLETKYLCRKRADSARTVQGKRGRANASQTTPKSESNGLLRRNSSRRKGLRRRKTDADELMPEMRVLHSALSAHAAAETLEPPIPPTKNLRPHEGPSLLQIQIPNIELERYSVMFGDVLDPKPRQKPQPSLSSRRQGQLEELQPVTEPKAEEPLTDDLPKPHRRDESTSSKSSGRSPSFSLFPSTTPSPARSAVNKPLPKPSPLSRSVTAPDTTLSPPRSTIRASKSQDQDHVFVIVHTPEDTSSHTRKPSSNPTSTSANSTQASFFECLENIAPSATEKEPMRHTAQASREVFPARKSSMKKLPLTESLRHHQANDSMSTTAEVSIARQISISRRQRQLLVPIVPKVAQRPMQPTLVEGQSTTAPRKSHHLTLEDA